MLLAKQILQVLIARDVVAQNDYANLHKEKGNDEEILDFFLKNKTVSEEDIARIKADILHIPFVDLSDKHIPPQILKIVPEDIAQTYKLVPWSRDGMNVSVAMLNPQDFKAIEALDFLSRSAAIHFEYYVTTTLSLNFALRQYENLNLELKETLKAEKGEDSDEAIEEKTKAKRNSEQTAPVSKIVSVVLRNAVEGGASDIHIEPVNEGTRVRYRMDGVLHTSLMLPEHVHSSIIARIKVLSNLKIDETRLPQDGRFMIRLDGRDVEFRVSTLPVLHGEKVVMRILDSSSHLLNLESLGFVDRNLEAVKKSLKNPQGMILVTGPTGCGKTTTLYSLLTILNKEGINIVTLEDPIEYNLQGVAQSQVKPEIGLTFATGLRSILRQDPNIIMVGEIRDDETAELAVHSALTGHMVLSTLHTNDAFGAIPRLIDMNIEPFLLSSSLNIIVAQRLLRKICSNCKAEVVLSDKMINEVKKEFQTAPLNSLPKDIKEPYKFFCGKGCSQCEGTGYKGRIAIVEILEVTSEMQKIISSGESSNLDLVKKEFLRQGMITMRQDGAVKALRGLTTIEEVWAATKEQ